MNFKMLSGATLAVSLCAGLVVGASTATVAADRTVHIAGFGVKTGIFRIFGINTEAVMIAAVNHINNNGPLSGQTFVITGKLENQSRESAEKSIEGLGGSVTSSISKNTNNLIVGDKPGSKLKKAQKLNINIINEINFEKIIDDARKRS